MIKLITKGFNQYPPYVSSNQLEIGDLAIVHDDVIIEANFNIVMRTVTGFVLLSDPNYIFPTSIFDVKPLPDGITLQYN